MELLVLLLGHEQQEIRLLICYLLFDALKDDQRYQQVHNAIKAAWKAYSTEAFPEYDQPEEPPSVTDVKDF